MPEVNRSDYHVSRRQFLEVSAASLATFSLMDSRCSGKNANTDTASAIPSGQTLADLYREAAQVLFQARPLSATDNGLSAAFDRRRFGRNELSDNNGKEYVSGTYGATTGRVQD